MYLLSTLLVLVSPVHDCELSSVFNAQNGEFHVLGPSLAQWLSSSVMTSISLLGIHLELVH